MTRHHLLPLIAAVFHWVCSGWTCLSARAEEDATWEYEEDEYEEYSDDKEEDVCGLYLAPSAIPGTGFGMYSGSRPYQEGDRVGDRDLMVPVYDLDFYLGDETKWFLWDEYTWR